MLKKIRYTLLTMLILLVFYITLSYFLLNGNLIYTTSFNEGTIASSIEKNLFVSKNLQVSVEGDSLKSWEDYFDIWINKRYEIKYYGFLIHHTYTQPNWRYLNIKFKSNRQNTNWCVKKDDEQFCSECCDRIGCDVGDTIRVNFFKFRENVKLGTLTTVIQ